MELIPSLSSSPYCFLAITTCPVWLKQFQLHKTRFFTSYCLEKFLQHHLWPHFSLRKAKCSVSIRLFLSPCSQPGAPFSPGAASICHQYTVWVRVRLPVTVTQSQEQADYISRIKKFKRHIFLSSLSRWGCALSWLGLPLQLGQVPALSCLPLAWSHSAKKHCLLLLQLCPWGYSPVAERVSLCGI